MTKKKVGSQKSVVGSKKQAKNSVANKKAAPAAKKRTTKSAAANKRVSRKKPVYQKVGMLQKAVADAIGRKPGDICVSKGGLRHILEGHSVELAQFGLTPMMIIDAVMANYNRIYKGKEEALLMVVFGRTIPKVVIIEMAFEKDFYRVKTATVMRKAFLNKKELLWKE